MTELQTFPLQIAVFCDECGTEVVHDYVVHDLMTREQRLDVAREWLVRDEGWSCTAAGDFCPKCRIVLAVDCNCTQIPELPPCEHQVQAQTAALLSKRQEDARERG